MSGGAGTVTLERPATVTLANGQTINSNMTPEQRSAAIRGSMGLPAAPRPTAEPFGPPGPVAYKDQQISAREGATAGAPAPQHVEQINQWFRELPADKRDSMRGEYHARLTAALDTQPRSPDNPPLSKANADGTVSVSAHAGMVTPSPEELAAANSRLEQFDQEMRDKGFQKPLEEQQAYAERFQVDERTGIRVDTAALERAHELYKSMTPAEREAERADYHATLEQIYAGKLGLADMEDSPSGASSEQARDAQGRFAPSQPTTGSWQSHVEGGEWVDIGRLTTVDTHGYTIPRYTDDQRLNVSAFELLRQAKAAGISQAQVNEVFRQQAIQHGWVRA